jgi:hypothetical protein
LPSAGQVLVDIQEFLLEFAKAPSSAGGQDAIVCLQDSMDAVAQKAKIAKIFLIEVFLLKGLKQFKLASSQGDAGAEAEANAKGILLIYYSFVKHTNVFEITEGDLSVVLLELVKQAVPTIEQEAAANSAIAGADPSKTK